MQKYVYIDAANIFYAGYARNPLLNEEGIPIGGIFTLLNSVTQCVSQYESRHVVIIWEGERGTYGKRQYLPEYKNKAKISKYNRTDFVPALDNRKAQLNLVKEMLACLPVYQVCIQDLEGDDTLFVYSEYQKKLNGGFSGIIVSGDKDFYQLLNGHTIIFKPQKKTEYTLTKFQEEYGIINPRNFALYKMLVGDPADNIAGLKGMGSKKFIKTFGELLQSEKEISFDTFFSFMETEGLDAKVQKIYEEIKTNKEQLSKFYRAVKFDPVLLEKHAKEIEQQLSVKPVAKYNLLIILCMKNKIPTFFIEPLISRLGIITY